MPVNIDQPKGWTRKSAAVSVLLVMDEHRKAAGHRVVRLREQRGWNQEDLAHAAKVSVKTVSRFENGKTEGRRATMKALARALEVDEDAITGPPPAPLGLGEPERAEALPVAAQKQLDNIEWMLRLLVSELLADSGEVATIRAVEDLAAQIEGQQGTGPESLPPTVQEPESPASPGRARG